MTLRSQRSPIVLVTIAILIVTLFFGLKPRGYRFINQVTPTANGLSFNNFGMIFSEKKLAELGFTSDIGIAATAAPYRTGKVLSRLLCLIDENGREIFTIDQWMASIEVSLWDAHGRRVLRTAASNVLRRDSLCFFAAGVTKGTLWIHNGNDNSFQRSRRTSVRENALCSLRLIAGFGSAGENPWRGRLKKLALFTPKSDSTQINLIKGTLLEAGSVKRASQLGIKSLHTFSNTSSTNISNALSNNWKIVVPTLPRFFRYTMPEFIPTHISYTSSFIADIIVNFLGFIPLGIAALLLLTMLSPTRKHPVVLTLIATLSFSIIIETLQIFIPTRTSQLSDVVLNGLGGWIGALAGRMVSRKESTIFVPVVLLAVTSSLSLTKHTVPLYSHNGILLLQQRGHCSIIKFTPYREMSTYACMNFSFNEVIVFRNMVKYDLI